MRLRLPVTARLIAALKPDIRNSFELSGNSRATAAAWPGARRRHAPSAQHISLTHRDPAEQFAARGDADVLRA